LDTANITKNAISSLQELHFQKDKIPSRAKRKVRKNTIIYSTVRPNLEHYGFLENPADNLIVSTGFTTIDVHDKDVDSKFLYYLITQKNITDYLHGIGTNSTSSYPSIRPEDLGSLKFKVPPSFNEQKKIASVLSALDDKIELNNKINAELEQMAKTLYDYWFVQFDFPDANGNPYKSSGGAMVWSEELKREIPEGWGVKKLSDIESNIVTGKTP
jgi:type I restriction enzyme S subunit